MTQSDEVDATGTHVNLANIVFDDNNEERRSWVFLGQQISRSATVFLFQCTVVLVLLACSVLRIVFSKSCEETTVWIAVLSSTVGYVLPSPKL